MMRYRAVLCMLLTVVLLLSLTACGRKAPDPTPTQEAPAQQAPTEQSDAALPEPKGADSVKTLMEISLDYFHSGGDYDKIAQYHDPRAYLAWWLMEESDDEPAMDLAQAMDRAALIYGSADALQAQDPQLATMVMEETDAMDPEEFLSEYMGWLRDAIKNGDIPRDDPGYESASQLLVDWDKGADYVFEHHPEVLQAAEERGVAIGLEGAMAQIRQAARFEGRYRRDRQAEIFKRLECEYLPENTNVNANGICAYDMGKVVDGYDVWYVTMLYYVRDGLYYLIGYEFSIGSVGG